MFFFAVVVFSVVVAFTFVDVVVDAVVVAVVDALTFLAVVDVDDALVFVSVVVCFLIAVSVLV